MKEDRECWRAFFIWLKERGLKGVRLIVGDKCSGTLETMPEVFPEAKDQRCTFHFSFLPEYFLDCSQKQMKEVTRMLKAIHAQECNPPPRKKPDKYVKNSGK